ncbi:MAG: hypothetical protein N2747_11685, partial [Chitinophagaceae bacterium]|nr:hypothetical protein [Chitinophagaceae bacterium]
MRYSYIYIKYFFILIYLFFISVVHSQGNHVFSGHEAVNYGVVDLTTSTLWSTVRSATPGFFSAVGTASYTGASDNHNIDGYVKHYVTAAGQGFVFPVGTGSDLRTLQTSGTI